MPTRRGWGGGCCCYSTGRGFVEQNCYSGAFATANSDGTERMPARGERMLLGGHVTGKKLSMYRCGAGSTQGLAGASGGTGARSAPGRSGDDGLPVACQGDGGLPVACQGARHAAVAPGHGLLWACFGVLCSPRGGSTGTGFSAPPLAAAAASGFHGFQGAGQVLCHGQADRVDPGALHLDVLVRQQRERGVAEGHVHPAPRQPLQASQDARRQQALLRDRGGVAWALQAARKGSRPAVVAAAVHRGGRRRHARRRRRAGRRSICARSERMGRPSSRSDGRASRAISGKEKPRLQDRDRLAKTPPQQADPVRPPAPSPGPDHHASAL